MSIHVMRAVWESPREIDGLTKYVLLRLADFASDDGGSVFPSLGRVAEDCRIGERTVRNAFRALEAAGILVMTAAEDAARHKPRTYRIDLEALSTPGTTCRPAPHAARHHVPQPPARGAPAPGTTCPRTVIDPPENRQDISGDLFGEQATGGATVIVLPAKAKAPTNPAKPSFPEQAFAEFWNAYPSPDEEKATRAAFRAALKRGATPAGLIDAARAYAEKVAREGRERQFITRAKNFLRNDAWKDATETAATPTAGNSKPRRQSIQDAASRVFADTPEARAFREAL